MPPDTASGGMVFRRPVQTGAPTAEYLLTGMGRRFGPVLGAMIEWGTLYAEPASPDKSD